MADEIVESEGSEGDLAGYRRFMAIWAAQLVARISNGLTPFALSIYAYQQTGLSGSVALLTLAGFLPGVVLTPLAGVLADRYDRRLLMALSNVIFGVGLLMLLVTLRAAPGNLALVCVCLALSSAASAILDPAYRAIVTDLLTPVQYARAGGLVQLGSAGQFLIAPVVAGIVMAHFDVGMVVLLDLGLTAIAALAMLLIPSMARASRSERGAWGDFRAGLRFLAGHRGVATLVLIAAFLTFCMGVLQTLLTPMLLDLTSAEVLGIVRSTAAVGMVVASLFIGVFDMGRHHRRSMAVALAFGGVVVAGMGVTVNVALIGVFAFAFFLTLPPLNTSVEVLARAAIPNELQGKVWGLIGMISQLGYVVAYAVSGVLADNVFNPLLQPGGVLADSWGLVFGVGHSRGIGPMFALVGVMLIVIGVMIPRARSLRGVESELARALDETGSRP